MTKAKANSQNIYAIVTVMDVRIRNLEPGPGKFESILILALRIMTLILVLTSLVSRIIIQPQLRIFHEQLTSKFNIYV